MNSRQNAKLNMYMIVDQFLIIYAVIISVFPKYHGFYSDFKRGMGEVQLHFEEQMLDKTGITNGKTELRFKLINETVEISKKLQAHATFENDPLLLSETKLNASQLRNKSGTKLVAYAQTIIDRAETHRTELLPFGQTEENLAALVKALTDFQASIPKGRISDIESSQSTSKLKDGFILADNALKNIDLLVEVLKLPHPDFYKGYKASRRIILKGIGSLSTRYHVTDAATGLGIKGATITVTLAGSGPAKSNRSNIALEKNTANKGWANDKTLAEGMYMVSVRKTGYTEKNISFAVTDEEMNLFEAELDKIV